MVTADPNTQVDWWIAQCWQQAQAGMDEHSLVSWLHENGLTAKSSFIIIQAALNCSPADAKRIVTEHPVWADSGEEVPDDSTAYTSDVLEPEPEPDPLFELDDWTGEEEDEEDYEDDSIPEPAFAPQPEPTEPLHKVELLADREDEEPPADDMPCAPEPLVETHMPEPAEEPPAPAAADIPCAPEPLIETHAPEPAEELPAPAAEPPYAPEPAPAAPPAGAAVVAYPAAAPAATPPEPAPVVQPAPQPAAAAAPATVPPVLPPLPAFQPLPPLEMMATGTTHSAPPLFSTPKRTAPPPPVFSKPAAVAAHAVAPAEEEFAAEDPLPMDAMAEEEPIDDPVNDAMAGEESFADAVTDDAPAADEPEEDQPDEYQPDADEPEDYQPEADEPEEGMDLPALPPGMIAAMAGEAGDDAEAGDEPEPSARKRRLLDPEDPAPGPDAAEPVGLPDGETDEDLKAAARKLGISFRDNGDPDMPADPEMAEAARKLGIKFREDGPELPDADEETAAAAAKLGINFREGDRAATNGRKGIAKYVHFFLILIGLVFLLLMGVTFAGDLVAWVLG